MCFPQPERESNHGMHAMVVLHTPQAIEEKYTTLLSQKDHSTLPPSYIFLTFLHEKTSPCADPDNLIINFPYGSCTPP
jgi:hypothetical protein